MVSGIFLGSVVPGRQRRLHLLRCCPEVGEFADPQIEEEEPARLGRDSLHPRPTCPLLPARAGCSRVGHHHPGAGISDLELGGHLHRPILPQRCLGSPLLRGGVQLGRTSSSLFL